MSRMLIFEKRSYLIEDTSKAYHCTEGMVAAADLRKADGSEIVTNKGTKGVILDSGFMDKFSHLRRLAQVMVAKDLSWILGVTGLDADSVVVEAGTGSGGATAFLSHYAKHVYSYDVRNDHQTHAKKNLTKLGCSNVTFHHGDVCDGIVERDVDVVLLDMPEASKALQAVYEALRHGGYLIVYVPQSLQVHATFVTAKEAGILKHIKTVEVIEREWVVDTKKLRPAHGALGHTGFLSLYRKIR